MRPGVLLPLPEAPAWLPSVEDTWCLLSQLASKRELLAAGDFIVSGPSRYEEPASTIMALRSANERFAGCAGARLRNLVLPLIRTGVESPMESVLRLVIVEAGISEPRTSCPVHVRGRTLHADLGYPELRIAIEYEGAYHFDDSGSAQAKKDLARVRAMEAAGWKVLRACSQDIRDPRAFLADLLAAITERAGRQG